MFRSNWHIGLALILASVLAWITWDRMKPPALSSFEQPQQQYAAAYSNGGDRCSQDDLKAIVSSVRRRHAEERCASNAGEHLTDQESLKEARKASFYAEQANDIAVEQSKNAAFQSAALVFTIIIAAWAALEAGRAVIVTRQVGVDQSRAYVLLHTADLKFGDDKASSPRLKFTILNTGQTPAKWFEVRYLIFPYDLPKGNNPPAQPEFSEIDFSKCTWARNSALAQGYPRSIYADGLIDAQIIRKAYIAESDAICFAGTIRYLTFFGEIFETEFYFIVRDKLTYKQSDIHEDHGELPQAMSRASVNLRTYERVKS